MEVVSEAEKTTEELFHQAEIALKRGLATRRGGATVMELLKRVAGASGAAPQELPPWVGKRFNDLETAIRCLTDTVNLLMEEKKSSDEEKGYSDEDETESPEQPRQHRRVGRKKKRTDSE